MENLYADLHIHTNFSDGSYTPEDAVRSAKKAGLAAISITDHDIIDGIPAALREGKELGIEVIPGIELSTEIRGVKTTEMHILGYYVNWENLQFQESLTIFRTTRRQRAFQILDKLAKLGVRLDEKRIFALSGSGSIGRLHFAKCLIEQGFATGINDAFQKFLGIGKAAYVPKLRITPEEAIRMILRVGGIPVLAHPYYGHYSNKNLIRGLVRSGLRGIEVWHSKHPPAMVDLFSRLAREMGLLSTGGSDFHGDLIDEFSTLGAVKIPYQRVMELKRYKERLDDETKNIFIPDEPAS